MNEVGTPNVRKYVYFPAYKMVIQTPIPVYFNWLIIGNIYYLNNREVYCSAKISYVPDQVMFPLSKRLEKWNFEKGGNSLIQGGT